MPKDKSFNLKHISIRVIAVLILSILIWNVTVGLSETFIGNEYSSLSHFLVALITTILTLTLIHTSLKIDNISWHRLWQSTARTNIASFLLGIALCTVPASIGLIICLMLGWTDIKNQADLSHLLLSMLTLFIIVFLIEALPEELIFRGYMYRYLNTLFPHWGTIILQALLFSIFAYFIGAMYSMEQLQFIPGFALILGVFRAISGNVWTSIGFHVAIMTATQILGPVHGLFEVSGMFTLQFFAFILLPSIIGAIVLSFMYPNYSWRKKETLG